MIQRLGLHFHFKMPQSAFGIAQGAIEQLPDIQFTQRLQLENLRARYERRVNEEKRIVRGGTNESNNAAFHVGQEYVLLRFVEAMDLVNKK